MSHPEAVRWDDPAWPRTKAVFEAALARQWTPQTWEVACDLGVDATLYRLASAWRWPITSAARQRFREHSAQTLWRRQHVAKLVKALDGLGPLVWLKGEAAARVIYGDALARRSGDVDLLLPRRHVEEAGRRLRELGLRPMHRQRPEPWLYDEWGWVDPGTALVVELHWSLCPPPWPQLGVEQLAGMIVPMEGWPLGGQTQLYALSLAGQGAQLALHFAHHAGHLKGLVDVAGWWDRCARDQPEAIELARQWSRAHGVSGALAWAMGVILAMEPAAQVERSSLRLDQGLDPWRAALIAWTTRRLGGALSPRGDASVMWADKGQQTGQGQVMAWQTLTAAVLDDAAARRQAACFPWVRSAQVMAAQRGASQPSARDHAQAALRPLALAREAMRAARRGNLA